MIRKVSTKPIIKTTFTLVDQDNDSIVTFRFDIEAKGIQLRSESTLAQVQHENKFLRGVKGGPLWSDETVAGLSASIEMLKVAHSARRAALDEFKATVAAYGVAVAVKNGAVDAWIGAVNTKKAADDRWARAFGNINSESYDLAVADYKAYREAVDAYEVDIDARKKELDISTAAATLCNAQAEAFRPQLASLEFPERAAKQQLDSVWKEMANPDFFNFFSNYLFLLKCEDSSDERSYALLKGMVWSCSRELEPAQWILLINRYIKQEDMELAAALGGNDSSPSRERIPTDVRRAVWIRDQGKCARCGSRERLEYDHIVPESRGGNNTERNIELLCEVCNRAKSDAIM